MTDAARENIEIKTRVKSLARIRPIAELMSTDYVGVLHQTDTYFDCRHGRLKLREFGNEQAELIWYDRSNSPTARSSQYTIVPCGPQAAVLKQTLTSSMGLIVEVVKRREVFLKDNVRIHLDEVEELGEFLELEAVMSPEMTRQSQEEQVYAMLAQLEISENEHLANSYADLLIER